MLLEKKTFRYYYWLTIEFLKKHVSIILISFFVSLIIVISFISFFPYIQTFLFSKKNIVGLLGSYDLNSVPEEITSKISNGLLFINEKGEFLPALSSSWEVADKGKEYRFHLRDGLIWSNGKKFTAYDIQYQFKDVETKIIDERTIYFKLKKPLPIFPTFLKKPIIRQPLLGIAGLYKVDRLKTRFDNIVEVSLTPNNKDLTSITYKFYSNDSLLTSAFKKGEINQMTVTKKSVADVFSQWKNSTVKRNVDYSRLMTLFFNSKNEFLKDKDVRNALITAEDFSKFKEVGEIAIGPIPPTSWAFNPNLKPPVFDRDIARKTLKKTNLASESAKLNLYTYYDYLSDADTVVQNLKDVGLDVNINLVSSENPSNFDLLLSFWNVPVDPDQYFFWHSTQMPTNIGNYKNVKIDKLLEDARNTAKLSERKKFYFDFQKVINDDPPAAFFYFPYVYTIKRK